MAEWYSPGYSPSPRRERPAEPLWTLERNGRHVACELRDHGEPAGAEVQLLRNGEFYAGESPLPLMTTWRPMLATAATVLPSDAEWTYEVK
jgi:hypothetical protein